MSDTAEVSEKPAIEIELLRTEEQARAYIDEIKAALADEIRFDRQFYGLTQAEYGALCGMHQTVINDIERGRLTRFTVDRLMYVLLRQGHQMHAQIL